MRGFIAILLASIMCCGFPSLAPAADELTTPAYAQCIKKSGGVTSEIFDCNSTETDRQTAKLNQIYQRLIATVSASRKQQLVDAQKAWMKYRKLNCAFYYDPEGGTAARLAGSSCLMTMTANRAAELTGFLGE
jgi:uncharacterized protein YecT (DUF1311 family)